MSSPRRTGTIVFEDGELPWILDGRVTKGPLLILAHGAGANMESAFMERVSTELADRKVAVLRFDFPYMQRARLEGRRRPPDRAPRLIDAWQSVLDHARKPKRPLFLGGKSMGGRMASMLLAERKPRDIAGAVYLGYPLHPPGKPERLRIEHLPRRRGPPAVRQRNPRHARALGSAPRTRESPEHRRTSRGRRRRSLPCDFAERPVPGCDSMARRGRSLR